MAPATRFLVGEWSLTTDDGVLRREGATRRLGPKPLAVLLYLAARPGHVVAKEELLAAVWSGTHVEEGSLTRCVFQIRAVLGDDRSRPRYVETIPKRGYRFLAAPVLLPPRQLTQPRRPRARVAVLAVMLGPLVLGLSPRMPAREPGRVPPARLQALSETAQVALALEYYRRGQRQDNENALHLFESVLTRRPALTRARAGMADAYVQRGRQFGFGRHWIDRALIEADVAVAEDPDLPEAHKARALALAASGHLQEAIAANRRALALRPSYGEAWSNLGRALRQLGQWADALSCFARRSELDPTSATAAADLGGILADLGFEVGARRWLEHALTLEPVATEANLEMAWLEMGEGQLEGARRRLEKLVAAAPQCARCWASLAASQRAEGGRDRALRSLESGRRAAAGMPERALLDLRLALVWSGRDELRVRELLAQVETSALEELREGSERFTPRYLMATVAALRGQPDSAVRWLEQAVGAGYLSAEADTGPAFEALRGRPRARRLFDVMRARWASERARAVSAPVILGPQAEAPLATLTRG